MTRKFATMHYRKRCRIYSSGRFVKQEQWERWRANRKLVSGSKHRGRFCGSPGVLPP